MPSLWSGVAAATLAALAFQLRSAPHELAASLEALHVAESSFGEAEVLWAQAMHTGSHEGLAHALRGYSNALGLIEEPVPAGVGIAQGLVRGFAGWLGRPLKLTCLHRSAAAQELLRVNLAEIAGGYEALLREGYCEQLATEAATGQALSTGDLRRQHEACLAPIARGTIQFAASVADAEAAFGRAVRFPGPGGGAALSWTTRWQLPGDLLLCSMWCWR
jgi:hypothetical protein